MREFLFGACCEVQHPRSQTVRVDYIHLYVRQLTYRCDGDREMHFADDLFRRTGAKGAWLRAILGVLFAGSLGAQGVEGPRMNGCGEP